MTHLGVVYRFTLRESGKPTGTDRLLGSIDGAGTGLSDVAPDLLESIQYKEDVEGFNEPQPQVVFDRSIDVPTAHQHAAVLQRHEHGTRGILYRRAEGDETPFTEVDNQQVEVVVVISAPPMSTVGFVGFHVPNGKGVKTGVEAELRKLFKQHYNLLLIMSPVVPLEAVEKAIEEQGIGSVSFRKLNNPAGLFASDDAWWTESKDLGTVEFRLKPRRSTRLLGKKIVDFIRTKANTLSDDVEAVEFSDLATFNEQLYDELAVEVFIGGRKKMVRITREGHGMSHAFSWELDADFGDPTRLALAVADLLPR